MKKKVREKSMQCQLFSSHVSLKKEKKDKDKKHIKNDEFDMVHHLASSMLVGIMGVAESAV